MNNLETNTDECCHSLDNAVGKNPTEAILIALGVGLAVAFMLRASNHPRSFGDRATTRLDDLREQLNDLARPARRRASTFAANGTSAAQDVVEQLSSLRPERTLHQLSTKLRNLFC